MSIKILATADLHLGKRSADIPFNNESLSTKHTWGAIVDMAIKGQMDVVVLCGDIVDQDNRFFEAIGALEKGFQKLKDANIEVIAIAGNHDFAVFPALLANERHPNVHLLGRNGIWESSHFKKNNIQVQFFGWCFPERIVNYNPVKNFPAQTVDPSIFSIGLVHGDVGNMLGNYAPIDLTSLKGTGLDMWLLGHIHKPAILNGTNPYIGYPGSPHAMSMKERGSHGVTIITIEESKQFRVTQTNVSPVRYEIATINVSACSDKDKFRNVVVSELIDQAAEITDINNASFLVYDLELIGEHESVEDIEIWAEEIASNDLLELPSGVRIITRKTKNLVSQSISNLEDLAMESSPAGIIASAILLLKQAQTNPFIDSVEKEFRYQLQEMRQSAVYVPLKTNNVWQQQDITFNELFVEHCNLILSNLIHQKAN